MKKEWRAPQLMGLGVQNTKENEELNENAKILITCPWCGKLMLFWELEKHKKSCPKKPAAPGEGPFPLPTPEVMPVS